MASVALVLFALERFHSPAIAGVTVFASAFPGIAMSPLAGAILDRSGRIKLIMLDYSIAAAGDGPHRRPGCHRRAERGAA